MQIHQLISVMITKLWPRTYAAILFAALEALNLYFIKYSWHASMLNTFNDIETNVL